MDLGSQMREEAINFKTLLISNGRTCSELEQDERRYSDEWSSENRQILPDDAGLQVVQQHAWGLIQIESCWGDDLIGSTESERHGESKEWDGEGCRRHHKSNRRVQKESDDEPGNWLELGRSSETQREAVYEDFCSRSRCHQELFGQGCCILAKANGLGVTCAKEDPSKHKQVLAGAVEAAWALRQDVVADARWTALHTRRSETM